jgi:hypothetical protein
MTVTAQIIVTQSLAELVTEMHRVFFTFSVNLCMLSAFLCVQIRVA